MLEATGAARLYTARVRREHAASRGVLHTGVAGRLGAGHVRGGAGQHERGCVARWIARAHACDGSMVRSEGHRSSLSTFCLSCSGSCGGTHASCA
jgi:hypothetical protein